MAGLLCVGLSLPAVFDESPFVVFDLIFRGYMARILFILAMAVTLLCVYGLYRLRSWGWWLTVVGLCFDALGIFVEFFLLSENRLVAIFRPSGAIQYSEAVGLFGRVLLVCFFALYVFFLVYLFGKKNLFFARK